MRSNGLVHLPVTQSKKALLVDLEYFSFHVESEAKIQAETHEELPKAPPKNINIAGAGSPEVNGKCSHDGSFEGFPLQS